MSAPAQSAVQPNTDAPTGVKHSEWFKKEFTTVNGRPVPKEPLSFFQYKKGNRLFVTIVDQPQTWVEDLPLAEKVFADMVICPFQSESEQHGEKLTVIQDVLKQRMKYPGIRDSPDLLKIAKTWILPQKLRVGPSADSWVGAHQDTIRGSLAPLFTELELDGVIHVLKIEVANGRERSLLYSLLDAGFRPSLLLVKWGFDLDDHIPTAHCAGHVLNSGYSLVSLNEGYALYMFTEQTLYDICSMKNLSIENPMMASILESATEHLRSPTNKPSSTVDSTPLETIPEGVAVEDEAKNSSA